MSIFKLFIISILSLVGLSGCVTTKKITYFQNEGKLDTTRFSELKDIKPELTKIQVKDLLTVSIVSLTEEYNRMFEVSSNQKEGTSLNGYEVNNNGFIELPLLGLVKVAGLTPIDASDTIRKHLEKYLKEAFVAVKIINHKYTILGEVNRPGVFSINDGQTTIIEALGMAGDLTPFGKRENITIIRKDEKSRYKVKLNLLSESILYSPYYYLQNGDIIYVDVSDSKALRNNIAIQTIPVVLSVISVLSTLTLLLTR